MTGERTNKQRAFLAATRRLPHFELSIRRLIETDDTFREICEELVDAETALVAASSAPSPLRQARQDEWQGLVDRLVREIDTIVRRKVSADCRIGSSHPHINGAAPKILG